MIDAEATDKNTITTTNHKNPNRGGGCMPPNPKPHLTVPAIAERLGRTDECVRQWTTKGCHGRVLPSFKIAGRRYIKEADLEAFLDALNAPPAKGA